MLATSARLFPASTQLPGHCPRRQPTAPPAYWTSWADTLPVLHQQLPALTATILQALQHLAQAPPTLHAVLDTARSLRYAGWQPPEWSGFIELPIPTPPSLPLGRTNGYSRGWQHRVTKPIHASCWSPSTLAVGPNCSRPLIPVVKRCSIHKLVRLQAELSQPSFRPRVHVFVRPVPHFAAPSSPSPAPVVSPSPLLPMPSHSRSVWRSSRSMCYLGGTAKLSRASGKGSCQSIQRSRVANHVLVSDLNVATTSRLDNRRIEVIAYGLPLHNGAIWCVTSSGYNAGLRTCQFRPTPVCRPS